jgi:glutamate/tyrosine decarboxylase-like PLP-dependent enzyme
MMGHCDELHKLKELCKRHQLWLHVTGLSTLLAP